jgi:hypothetical protein
VQAPQQHQRLRSAVHSVPRGTVFGQQ